MNLDSSSTVLLDAVPALLQASRSRWPLRPGFAAVQDRCPKIEHGRLFGEIGWAGVNRRVISAKKGQARQLSRPKAAVGRPPTMGA